MKQENLNSKNAQKTNLLGKCVKRIELPEKWWETSPFSKTRFSEPVFKKGFTIFATQMLRLLKTQKLLCSPQKRG